MEDHAIENMVPHIETITIYNYSVENWENTIIPTKKCRVPLVMMRAIFKKNIK